jgi:hypothetical protein
MTTLSTTFFRDGLRHPVRALQQWSRHAPITSDKPDDERTLPAHDAQSSERLERIAAYARCGYFQVEYTAGMFVVPLDLPPE